MISGAKEADPQHRSPVVIGAMICQFCAGMLYSWSVFQTPIAQQFGWDASAVALTFSISTFLFPVAMTVAGMFLPRWGPRRVALLGGVVLAAGLLIASQARSLPVLYLGFGVLGGIGVGTVYGVPISTCAGWFPESAGLITGLAVAGFGLGSSVYAPIATHLIGWLGPMTTLLIQGCIAFVGVGLGSMLLKAPPAEAGGGAQSAPARSYTPGEMLRTGLFWMLFVMYIFANGVGLMIVGNASPMGQQLAQITAVQASAVVSILSIANTLGRFLGGYLADRFGPFPVVLSLFLVDTVILCSMGFMTTFARFAVAAAVLACCFGGMVGVYPSMVLKFFGTAHYSVNYGLVFLAFGVGGLLGPQVAAQALRLHGAYAPAFWIAGGVCLAGAGLAVLCRRYTARTFSKQSS